MTTSNSRFPTQIGRIILAGAIVVILLSVIHFATPITGGLWLRTLYDSLHVPIFGIIAVCILFVTPANWGSRSRLVATMGAVIVLSLFSESVQIPANRDASLQDIVSNLLGASGFVCVAVACSRGFSLPKIQRSYITLLGIAFITWPLFPLAKVSAAYVERVRILPSLVRFESHFASTFLRLQNAEIIEQRAGSLDPVSAIVLLGNGPWPGIEFHDLWPNWEPYTALIIEIENPDSKALDINIRVHDRNHRGEQRYSDRFNRSIVLAPGPQSLRIKLTDIQDAPADRQMDMAKIDGLIIFATQEESGRRFVLYEVRLE